MMHTYSAGGIVINENGQVLLINEGGDFWGIPKGRQEAGESLLNTALREIEEESGLTQITLLDELGTYQRHPYNSGHEDTSELKHITIFLFRADNASVKHDNIENNEVNWVTPSKAIALLTHPRDREFLALNLATISR